MNSLIPAFGGPRARFFPPLTRRKAGECCWLASMPPLGSSSPLHSIRIEESGARDGQSSFFLMSACFITSQEIVSQLCWKLYVLEKVSAIVQKWRGSTQMTHLYNFPFVCFTISTVDFPVQMAHVRLVVSLAIFWMHMTLALQFRVIGLHGFLRRGVASLAGSSPRHPPPSARSRPLHGQMVSPWALQTLRVRRAGITITSQRFWRCPGRSGQ